MKDSLFEMLLSLFEKTLTQLKEQHTPSSHVNRVDLEKPTGPYAAQTSPGADGADQEIIQTPHSNSVRVFTFDERLKFTKTSYQFLMRMMALGILAQDMLERVINRMIFSDSRFVTLQETKWIIRHTLADKLNSEQLAFLDLVLYQSEDGLTLH